MMSNIVLKGNLNYLSLAELLQLLGGAGSTGVIKISSMYAEGPGLVFLKDGNPIDAKYMSNSGIDALFGFFGWLEAQFEFSDETVLASRTIKKSRMEIILDGLRKFDDGLIPKLGQSSGTQKIAGDVKDESGVPVIKGPLIDYLYIVDEDDFSDGQEVVVQEKFGNWLWVILEGVVEVVRLLPEGQAPIIRLSDGAFVGSISALKEKSNVRSATVTAVGRVQLGVIDYQRILEEFTKVSDEFKDIMASYENRLKQITNHCAEALYKKYKPLKQVNNLKQLTMAENADNKVLKIINGKAAVIRKENNQLIHLCTLSADDVLGDIPFLNSSHEPHSASVYVSSDFESHTIDLMEIKEEFDQLSITLKNMLLHTSACNSMTTGRLIDLLKNDSD